MPNDTQTITGEEARKMLLQGLSHLYSAARKAELPMEAEGKVDHRKVVVAYKMIKDVLQAGELPEEIQLTREIDEHLTSED